MTENISSILYGENSKEYSHWTTTVWKLNLFKSSETHTVCHWKGTASYYTIEVDGAVNQDAAWYYPDPSNLAEGIKDHVAFWRGVEVTK